MKRMSTKKDTEQDLKEALNHIRCLLLVTNKASTTTENARLFLCAKTKRPAFRFLKAGCSWFTSKGAG